MVMLEMSESPRILEGNDLKALAKYMYMKSDSCHNVFLKMVNSVFPMLSSGV